MIAASGRNGPMTSNRKRGQGSSWTVAPAEEKDQRFAWVWFITTPECTCLTRAVIAIKGNARYRFHAAAILLILVLHVKKKKGKQLTKVQYYSKLSYHT
jgi:hypothetical protein